VSFVLVLVVVAVVDTGGLELDAVVTLAVLAVLAVVWVIAAAEELAAEELEWLDPPHAASASAANGSASGRTAERRRTLMAPSIDGRSFGVDRHELLVVGVGREPPTRILEGPLALNATGFGIVPECPQGLSPAPGVIRGEN
jgi:hypothetical protein